jgi:hypothetical protein
MRTPCRLSSLLLAMRLAGCMYVMMLGIFALIDSCNGKTYPLLSWVGMTIAETIVMLMGLVLATYGLLWHPDKSRYVDEGIAEKTSLLNASGKPTDRGSVATEVSKQYMRSVAHMASNFVFFGTMSVTAMWSLVQVAFVYLYTKDEPGFQTQLDKGFPTDEALHYAIYFKFQYLFTVQIQAALALVLCIAGAASGQISKHATA